MYYLIYIKLCTYNIDTSIKSLYSIRSLTTLLHSMISCIKQYIYNKILNKIDKKLIIRYNIC